MASENKNAFDESFKNAATQLLEHGADIANKDRYGENAIEFATRCGKFEMVELLQKFNRPSPTPATPNIAGASGVGAGIVNSV